MKKTQILNLQIIQTDILEKKWVKKEKTKNTRATWK